MKKCYVIIISYVNSKLMMQYDIVNDPLVGGLEHCFYFSIIFGNVIIPTDFHIFQRGWNHQPDIN